MVPPDVIAIRPGAVARPDGAGGTVPHEPGPQLREPVARVAAGEHVEDRENTSFESSANGAARRTVS